MIFMHQVKSMDPDLWRITILYFILTCLCMFDFVVEQISCSTRRLVWFSIIVKLFLVFLIVIIIVHWFPFCQIAYSKQSDQLQCSLGYHRWVPGYNFINSFVAPPRLGGCPHWIGVSEEEFYWQLIPECAKWLWPKVKWSNNLTINVFNCLQFMNNTVCVCVCVLFPQSPCRCSWVSLWFDIFVFFLILNVLKNCLFPPCHFLQLFTIIAEVYIYWIWPLHWLLFVCKIALIVYKLQSSLSNQSN